MNSQAQDRFNRRFDPAFAEDLRREMVREVREEITFPLSTIPVFLSMDLVSRICREVKLYFDCIREPDYREQAVTWVPSGYQVGDEVVGIPRSCSFDFALTIDPDGRLAPRLIECQGLSSLIGIVPWFGHLICRDMAPGWSPFLAHPSWEAFRADLERVLGNSLLIDIDPPSQRLRIDFAVLKRFADMEIVDLDRATLERVSDSQERLFSRVVPIEAERRGRQALLEELHQTPQRWVFHPDWYFMLSKRSLERFGEVSDLVAETIGLTAESSKLHEGRTDLVLKPNDDYGGYGVELEPSQDDIRRALTNGAHYVLQERIDIEPVVQPPHGPEVFCELRVLCLDDRPVSFFCRLARERMCNIDVNAAYPWCGITVGLIPEEGWRELT